MDSNCRLDYVMINSEKHITRKYGELIGFVLGCAVLVAACGIVWANWEMLDNQEVVMQVLTSALVIVVLFLELMSILSKGKDRCGALTVDGVLLLGLPALHVDELQGNLVILLHE